VTRAAFWIDDRPAVPGTLDQHQEWQNVDVMGPVPDPKWEHIDTNGHYHARDLDEKTYPTLTTRMEHIDCDGSCGGTCDDEGFTVVRYHCAVCDEEVKPGLIDGPHSLTLPGLKSWSATVEGPSLPAKVSVKVEVGDEIWFGVAMVTETSFDAGIYKTTLVGVSPLGRRRGS
jgi:hypothetical protein